MWQQEVRFDHRRTLEAFGVSSRDAPAELRLSHPVRTGTAALLEDCNQVGTGPCTRLGSSTYAFVYPESVGASDAEVFLCLYSASNPSTAGVINARPRRNYLHGGCTQLFFTRGADGSWKYSKTGYTMVA